MPRKEKTVSLVLGSGGARGLAHIGIIQWLEERGYAIESISGCSMGALIGGVHACGKLDTFIDWVCAIDKLDIVRLLDVSWGKAGLVDGDKVIDTLKDLVGDRQIEDLPIKFTAVAADIKREKEIWITSGSLFDAIRASISLPLFFTPARYGSMLLLDGGILNPVPIAPTFEDKTDMTIAVNLNGPPDSRPVRMKRRRARREQDDHGSIIEAAHAKITGFIDDLSTRFGQDDGDWAMLDVAVQTFDAMQGTIARQKLAAYPPDRTIVIPRDTCAILEFDRAEEMIAIGRAAARAQMPGEPDPESPPGR